jgi:hypothetical protein
MDYFLKMTPFHELAPYFITVNKVKVVLDCDLAKYLGTTTSELNGAFKRNPGRITPDHYFKLSKQDSDDLKLNKLLSPHSYKNPYVLTEGGIFAAAQLVKTKKAAELSVNLIRWFFSKKG